MKAAELNNSVWSGQEGDLMVVTKVKGGYYGHNNEWDFSAKTAKETLDKLKKWGYEHIGWE